MAILSSRRSEWNHPFVVVAALLSEFSALPSHIGRSHNTMSRLVSNAAEPVAGDRVIAIPTVAKDIARR